MEQIQEIFKSLQEQDYKIAGALAGKLSSEELAELLSQVETADIPAFCREIDSDFLAEALVLLQPELQKQDKRQRSAIWQFC